MALQNCSTQRAQFHGDDFEAFGLKTGKDAAHQLAFNCIWLKEDEGSVAHGL
jgi:hypothetical protein